MSEDGWKTLGGITLAIVFFLCGMWTLGIIMLVVTVAYNVHKDF